MKLSICQELQKVIDSAHSNDLIYNKRLILQHYMFMQKILLIKDLIMKNETTLFSISRTTAQNAGIHLVPSMQPSKCEIALKKFISDKWFDEFKGLISFSSRTILELEYSLANSSLFLKSYPAYTAQCFYCREIVLYSVIVRLI